jgi:hypothetical protein
LRPQLALTGSKWNGSHKQLASNPRLSLAQKLSIIEQVAGVGGRTEQQA